MLSNKQAEKIVCMIAGGKNTYGDIKHIATLDWPDRFIYIDDYLKKGTVIVGPLPEKIGLIEFETVPEDYSKDYQFKDEDKFRLTIKGQNLFDKHIQEHRMFFLTAVAAIGGAIAVIDFILRMFGKYR